jgi:flagellar hook-associated protein 1
MSIGNIFDIATSGIAAQRLALEVTGENIANVNTQGYSRQQVNLESKLSINVNGVQLGTGVQMSSITRAYDNSLQQQVVSANSGYQESLTKETALNQIQPSFNELNSDGLGGAISGFFGAWQDLSINPQGTAERQTLIAKTQILTDNFHQISANLTTVATNADNSLTGIASDLTTTAKSLALINSQIITTQALGGNSNELMDQRDLMVRDLSKNVGITSVLQADGTATVTVAGLGTLVSGTKSATVYTSVNGAKNDVKMTALGAASAGSDATLASSASGIGGNLGGTLAVRDFIVPGYLKSLDSMASALVTAVNTQQAKGTDLLGGTGGTAGTGADFFSGSKSSDIALGATLNSNTVAAAANPSGGTGDNTNALAMAGIQNSNLSFTEPSGTAVSAKVESFYNAFSGTVGTDVKSAQGTTTQGNAFLTQLNSLRASSSGVSLDEELTNLTKYQQAFQGAAKVINTATAMLDTVLAMVR